MQKILLILFGFLVGYFTRQTFRDITRGKYVRNKA